MDGWMDFQPFYFCNTSFISWLPLSTLNLNLKSNIYYEKQIRIKPINGNINGASDHQKKDKSFYICVFELGLFSLKRLTVVTGYEYF